MAGDEIIDAEWEEVPDNDGNLQVGRSGDKSKRSSTHSSRDQMDRSPWLDLAFWRSLPVGKVLLLGLAMLVLLPILLPKPSEEESNVATLDDAQPVAASESAQPITTSRSTDQILSDLAQYVTGVADTSRLSLMEGDGQVGEFCSSGTGKSMMVFGGRPLAALPDVEIYDFFSWVFKDDKNMIGGAFEFDATTGELLATRLIEGDPQTDGGKTIDDIPMRVSRVSPGVVEIDGTVFHMCVL